MIYWHSDSWQPAFRMWHELFHDIGSARRNIDLYRVNRKPKLQEEARYNAAVRANIARNAIQMWLLEYADVSPSDKLPHVEQKDVEKLADDRIHASMPEHTDATHFVLTKLGEVMRARHCEPPFPKLLPPRL